MGGYKLDSAGPVSWRIFFFLAQQGIYIKLKDCRLFNEECVGSFVKWTNPLNNQRLPAGIEFYTYKPVYPVTLTAGGSVSLTQKYARICRLLTFTGVTRAKHERQNTIRSAVKRWENGADVWLLFAFSHFDVMLVEHWQIKCSIQ